jgi:hypothetical protein
MWVFSFVVTYWVNMIGDRVEGDGIGESFLDWERPLSFVDCLEMLPSQTLTTWKSLNHKA